MFLHKDDHSRGNIFWHILNILLLLNPEEGYGRQRRIEKTIQSSF